MQENSVSEQTVALALFRPEMCLHNLPNLFFRFVETANINEAFGRHVANDLGWWRSWKAICRTCRREMWDWPPLP